jgi:hypothetical protein
VELANYFDFLSNLSSYALVKVWQGGQAVADGFTAIKKPFLHNRQSSKLNILLNKKKPKRLKKLKNKNYNHSKNKNREK